MAKRSKMKSFAGVCNYIRLMLPGSSVHIPLDKTAVNNKDFRALALKFKASREAVVKFEEPRKTDKNSGSSRSLGFGCTFVPIVNMF
ncbi:60S ribosomal protein L27 [Lemmus lemmus]